MVQLDAMSRKFCDFDLDGKKMYQTQVLDSKARQMLTIGWMRNRSVATSSVPILMCLHQHRRSTTSMHMYLRHTGALFTFTRGAHTHAKCCCRVAIMLVSNHRAENGTAPITSARFSGHYIVLLVSSNSCRLQSVHGVWAEGARRVCAYVPCMASLSEHKPVDGCMLARTA
jgi:hypothetical protein